MVPSSWSLLCSLVELLGVSPSILNAGTLLTVIVAAGKRPATWTSEKSACHARRRVFEECPTDVFWKMLVNSDEAMVVDHGCFSPFSMIEDYLLDGTSNDSLSCFSVPFAGMDCRVAMPTWLPSP